jgi:hypothetical protein
MTPLATLGLDGMRGQESIRPDVAGQDAGSGEDARNDTNLPFVFHTANIRQVVRTATGLMVGGRRTLAAGDNQAEVFSAADALWASSGRACEQTRVQRLSLPFLERISEQVIEGSRNPVLGYLPNAELRNPGQPTPGVR